MGQRYYDHVAGSLTSRRGGRERAKAAAEAIAAPVPPGGRCVDVAGGTVTFSGRSPWGSSSEGDPMFRLAAFRRVD
jgi:hypothetical protein